MIRQMICLPKFSAILLIAALLAVFQSPQSAAQTEPGQAASTSTSRQAESVDEPAYLHMSIADLVLGQTGNTNIEDRSRLCDGDRLVKWNGVAVRDNDHLVELWLASGTQDQVPVTVVRQFPSGEETLQIDYRVRLASQLFSQCTEGGRSIYRKPGEIFPELDAVQDLPLQSLTDSMIVGDAAAAVTRMASAFARLTDFVKGYYRSDHIVYLLNRPFHCESWSRKHCDAMATSDSCVETLKHCWALATPQIRTLRDAEPTSVAHPADLHSICAAITTRVEEINRHYQNALDRFAPAEKKTWNQWCRSVRPIWRGESGWDEFAAGFQLTKKLNTESLELAFALASQLADDLSPGGNLFEALKQLEPPTSTQVIQRVLVGATEDDQHLMTEAVTIDFGGNDRYRYPATGLDTALPVRLVVDLAGDDHYTGSTNAVAAGVAGVSVLIDAAGDDDYQVQQNGIGFAVCGVGLLLDFEGHDHYRGGTFCQGGAIVGVGLIAEGAGNDRYHAGSYSQAIGMPGGCGAILDRNGDDVYTCTGRNASPYGDQGEYEGMGQGCGFGFRHLGCGGIGILIDQQGRDFYRAGQFALGCGYFYGVGLVNDRDGDDVFECSRYGLGSAAHYAVGLVLDDKGNDFYSATRRAAVAELGSAWDLSLGALIDSGGNDVYRAVSYALGGAAQNAYGFMWDKAGDDHYLVGPQLGATLGYLGGANYGAGRGARNLAIFFDQGGQDVYSAAGAKNNSSVLRGEYAIQVDR